MRIREATEADLPAIVEIYNSTVPGRTVTADTEPVTVQQRADWFREHDPLRRPIRIAEDDGQILGWLSLGDFYDGRPAYGATAEIGVYVREGHRRGGVGKLLLEDALHSAPGLGIKTLTAGAFAHNTPSIGLFERHGFERWAHYPRVATLDGVERDLVMLGLRLDGTNRPGR